MFENSYIFAPRLADNAHLEIENSLELKNNIPSRLAFMQHTWEVFSFKKVGYGV